MAGQDGSAATWALVQVVSTTTPSLTIAPTGPGHLIVVALQILDTDTVTSVADNAANTYVRIPGAHATNNAGGDGLDVWYARSSIAGATTITASGPLIHYATVGWEFSGIDPVNALAGATSASDQPASTTPTSPTITTSQTGELVLALAVTVNDVTGIHAGNEFTNDSLANGSGWAHITSQAASAGPHVGQWDHNSNTSYLASAVAFFPSH